MFFPKHITAPIVLMTATGEENLGDELITLCEIRHLETTKPESSIILFSHNPDRTWRFMKSQGVSRKRCQIRPYFPTDIRHHPLRNIAYLFQTLVAFWRASEIYIGGGGLLYSASEEGKSPLRLWWMRALMARVTRTPLTYLSLGISARPGEIRPYARGLFGSAKITVRDAASQDIVTTLGYTAALAPDPVLSYVPIKKETNKTKTRKTVGIALRKGYIDDTCIQNVLKTLEPEYDIILLPHSLHPGDRNAHDGYYMQRFLAPGIITTQTIEQTLAAYHTCDLILGMRLHSMILAHVHGLPLIALSYSKKTDSLLKSLGYNIYDPRAMDSDTLLLLLRQYL